MKNLEASRAFFLFISARTDPQNTSFSLIEHAAVRTDPQNTHFLLLVAHATRWHCAYRCLFGVEQLGRIVVEPRLLRIRCEGFVEEKRTAHATSHVVAEALREAQATEKYNKNGKYGNLW